MKAWQSNDWAAARDHGVGRTSFYPFFMTLFLLSHLFVDSFLALASVASVTFFSVSPSITTVWACDTPFPCSGRKGQISCLAFNRMYTFLSSLPVMSIKAKERYMFLSLSLSLCTSATSRIPPVFHLDFVALGQVSVWHFKFPYLTKSWAFRPFLYATKHLIFRWLAKGVAVPSHGFPSVYLAVTFLS